jgi:hypothetical protein
MALLKTPAYNSTAFQYSLSRISVSGCGKTKRSVSISAGSTHRIVANKAALGEIAVRQRHMKEGSGHWYSCIPSTSHPANQSQRSLVHFPHIGESTYGAKYRSALNPMKTNALSRSEFWRLWLLAMYFLRTR